MRYKTRHNCSLHKAQNVNKFFRAVALEKEKLREISSTYQRRSVHFYSSVHFYRSCWICRKVWKWIHREVHYKITEQEVRHYPCKTQTDNYLLEVWLLEEEIHWLCNTLKIYISRVIRVVPKSNASVKYETYLF